VEILDPAGGPDNVLRVAAGEADFCLTSVAHYLTARAEGAEIPARFVAVVSQRSPMAGIVAADSDISEPRQLSRYRVGGPPEGRLLAEFRAALRHLGVPPSELVPMPYEDAPAALGRGEIEVVPDFADLLPRVRRQAGIPVRAVAFQTDVYASGLVAADRLPLETVARMRDAVVAALEEQRRDPYWGLDALLVRHPDVDRADALEGWRLAEPIIFTRTQPGSMDPHRWEETVAYATAALELRLVPADSVYRSEFATAAALGIRS